MSRWLAVWLSVFLMVVAVCLAIMLVVRIRSVSVVNTLNNRDIIKNPDSKYRFFYEVKPDTTINDVSPSGKSITYTQNHNGLNNLANYPVEKTDKIRIAAIGDSFTFGLNVSTKDNWVTLLEQSLNSNPRCKSKFEVLNFGVPGYDIDYVLERNRLRVEKYRPDLYIWFIKDDDFNESKEITTPIENKLNASTKYDVKYHIQAIDTMYRWYGKRGVINNEKSHLYAYLKSRPDQKFLLVIPKGDLTYPIISPEIEKDLFKLTASRKNINVQPVTLAKKDVFLPNDYHFNETGNRYFASMLEKQLVSSYCR